MRWLSIVGRTVDAGSGPTVVGFALDITEFKKTQSALLQSEALFRTLAETTLAAIFLHRGKEMVYATPAAVEVSGYSQDELEKMSFWATVHPDDRQKVVERGFARQRGESAATGYEIRIVTKSGEVRWLEIMGNPVMVDGHPSVLGTGLDITARKQAEQALRQSEELYRHLVETSPDAIIVTDVRGRLVMANQRIADLLRLESPEELLGRAALALLVDDDEDKARAATAETLESGAVHDLELRFLRSDGSEGLGEINVSRLDDADGQPSGAPFDVVILDLTVPGGMGGHEALERLRELDPEVQAVVSSGYSNDPIMSEHEVFGFCGVVTKPYTFTELRDVVVDLLGDEPS